MVIEFETLNDKGIFLKQAYELGLDKQIFSTSNTESVELSNNFKVPLGGIIFAYPKNGKLHDEFENNYKARFGKAPSTPNAFSTYDATRSLLLALDKNPKNSDELISALLASDFEGASSHILFDRYGLLSDKDFIIKSFRNGKFVELTN